VCALESIPNTPMLVTAIAAITQQANGILNHTLSAQNRYSQLTPVNLPISHAAGKNGHHAIDRKHTGNCGQPQ
jgi:hypothetical protein